MTAAQKIAKEKFKKAIAYRQKTGVSLKEAFAHVYGKKVSVFKKTAKKKVVRKKAAKKVGKVTLKKANYHPRDERYIIMNDGVPHLEGKPFFKETAKDVASALRKVKAKRKKAAKKVGVIKKKVVRKKITPKSLHKDTKSHNVNIRVMSGVETDIVKQLNTYKGLIRYYTNNIEIFKDAIKKRKEKQLTPTMVNNLKKDIKKFQSLIKEYKIHLTQLKKHI